MSKPVKYIAIALAILVVGGLVTALAFWTAGQDPDAVEPGLYLSEKKEQEPSAVLTIGGKEVPFTVYRQYYLLYKSYFESYAAYYGQDLSVDPDGDNVQSIKDAVKQELVNAYAWLQVAEEEGIALSEEDNDEIEQDIADLKAEYGSGFEAQLKDNMFFWDEDNYREILGMQKLVSKTQEAYTEKIREENSARLEKEADEDYEGKMIHVKHILLMVETTDTDGNALSDEAIAENRATAEAQATELLAQIEASEDVEATFDELMHEHSEDGGLESNPDGYTFDGTSATTSGMAEPFYKASKALEEGEVSEAVWNSQENYSGYHIILRLPLAKEDIEANRESYVNNEVNTLVNDHVTELAEAMEVTYSNFYNKMTLDSIR